MDIASTLLTKKAALIGGGTAATATAVTVPIVVTQKKEKTTDSRSQQGQSQSQSQTDDETDPDQSRDDDSKGSETTEEESPLKFSASLTFTDDIVEDLNKPGDCVNKLFPNLKTNSSTFFTTVEGEDGSGLTITENEPFPANNSPELSCYILNWKNENDFRVEMTVIKEDKGWGWISGVRKESEKYKIYFKEFISKKTSEKWIVEVGQEGVVENYSGGVEFPKQLDHLVVWPEVDAATQEVCETTEPTNCQITKAKLGFWVPSNSPNKKQIVQITKNSGRYMVPWGTDTERHKSPNRKKIYKEGKWHKHNDNTVKALIKLDGTHVAKKEGDWTSLAKFCVTEEKKTDANYTTFCGK